MLPWFRLPCDLTNVWYPLLTEHYNQQCLIWVEIIGCMTITKVFLSNLNNLACWTGVQPQFHSYPCDGTFDKAHLLVADLCVYESWDYEYMKWALSTWKDSNTQWDDEHSDKKKKERGKSTKSSNKEKNKKVQTVKLVMASSPIPSAPPPFINVEKKKLTKSTIVIVQTEQTVDRTRRSRSVPYWFQYHI